MGITPACNNLFDNGNGKPSGKSQTKYFHKIVVKGLILSNIVIPGINPTIYEIAARVRSPNVIYCNKMVRVLKYLNGTSKYHLMFSIDDMRVIKWYVDASFSFHPDSKIHTGSIMMWGTGATQSGSMKKKLNRIFIMKSKVVVVGDMASNILWTKLFIEDQGCNVERNILYQDNNISVLMETNG